MTVPVSIVILSDSVHKDPPQTQREYRGILCSSGGKGGQDKRDDRDYNSPLESSMGWGTMFDDPRKRDVVRAGLIVADGLSGLGRVVGDGQGSLSQGDTTDT